MALNLDLHREELANNDEFDSGLPIVICGHIGTETRGNSLPQRLSVNPKTGASLQAGIMSLSTLHAITEITEREQLLAGSGLGYPAEVQAQADKLGAFAAACAAFSDLGLAYALIGGLAVGIRSGIPRATLDVNFAIPTSAARTTLIERLSRQGFRLIGQFAHSLNFQHESGEPAQLAYDAVFDAMIARAELMTFGQLEIPVVTKEDLLTMKRRAASDPARRRSKSLRDQADIALLEGDLPEPHEGW